MSRPFRACTTKIVTEPAAGMAALPVAVAFLLAAQTPGVHAQCPQYIVTAVVQGPECGILGFPPTFGTALSDNGEVVGWYTACTIGTDEAFYWSQETGFVTLDRPPGVFAAMASDISNEGTIVGTYQRNDVGNRGFIYKNGAWTELLPNEGGLYSWANAVSADGSTVVGARTGGLGGGTMTPYQAYLYGVDAATFTDLGVMNGPSSRAFDVAFLDNDPMVVGFTGASQTSLNARAFIHSMGRTIILGPVPEGMSSYGWAVSPDGTVLGGGRTENKNGATVHRAFTFANGEMTLLPLLPEHDDSRPGDIDEAGRAVGLSRTFSDSDSWRAWLWENGEILDLNQLLKSDLGIFLISGMSMNSLGQILCGAEFEGDHVAVVLTPLSFSIADLNHDCIVGSQDLMLLLEQWGKAVSAADFNMDGNVGPADLAMLLSQWG